jgi:hypothetical protein
MSEQNNDKTMSDTTTTTKHIPGYDGGGNEMNTDHLKFALNNLTASIVSIRDAHTEAINSGNQCAEILICDMIEPLQRARDRMQRVFDSVKIENERKATNSPYEQRL